MSAFDDLANVAEDADQLFDRAAQELASSGQWHRLFDLRLMQRRRELALPLEYRGSIDDVDEPLRQRLEAGYVAACREVGQLLLEANRLREAWMYLRPAGDKEAVRKYLERVVPDDENADELIEISLYEAVDPERGFAWLLGRNGTCNSITSLEGLHGQLEPEMARACAAVLLRHVYAELQGNLRGHLHRLEGDAPSGLSVAELVHAHPALQADGSYHLDVSHLSSTVRFARLLTDPKMVRLAVELCDYGSRLPDDLQYPGEPPFEDAYQAHRLFFTATLGENVDAAVDYFLEAARKEATSDDAADAAAAAAMGGGGNTAVETLLILLERSGRHEQALEAYAELVKPGQELSRQAPTLLALARQCGAWERYLEICQTRDDLVGYAAGLSESS